MNATDQFDILSVDLANTALKTGCALDSRTPKPDAATMGAWAAALSPAAEQGMTVDDCRRAVVTWSRTEHDTGLTPAAVVNGWRLARSQRRPDVREQEREEIRRANIANRLGGHPELPMPGEGPEPTPVTQAVREEIRRAIAAVAESKAVR